MGPDMAKANEAALKIFKIVEKKSKIDAVEMDEEKKLKECQSIEGTIEFKDVWFRYPTRPEEFVLRGLNLKIEKGQSVALVGESGCGKSTFVNLMMRFYDPEYGQILLDGEDIRNFNLHSFRKAVSLVMQEPIIFNYSILENILYSKLDATNSEILEVTALANCDEFINRQDVAKKTAEEINCAENLIAEMHKNKV